METSTFIFLLLIFLTSSNIRTSSCADDYRYANCSQAFECGNIQNIGYPFWGINRADYCGQPGFELKCQDNVPLITAASIAFRILDISAENQALMVAREDFYPNICPHHFYNTSLDSTIFRYASELRNLTLLYGCSSVPKVPFPEILREPDCFINGTNVKVFCVTRNLSFNPCNSSVTVPILETSAEALDNNEITTYEALRNGFGLQWRISNDQCENCIDSGGSCGFNRTTNEFACFCQDQPTAISCSSRPGAWLRFLFAYMRSD